MNLKKGLCLSCLVLALGMSGGCTKWQPTKNVWKGTKSLWYEYVSPPASIDYDDKGELSERGQALTIGMMNADIELTKLERIMINADKPPTRGWMENFFQRCPWVDGFAGVKSDGSLLGQEAAPGRAAKTLDFNAILYEDAKQNTRALRCDVQQTETGPEVLVAVPLYDGVDFLGAVVAYFDMMTLGQYAKTPQEVVIMTPQALLWPGRYDFAATPLAGIDWNTEATKSSAGTVSNSNGKFAYQIRWLGNMPIIFGVVDSGSFPDGNGSTAQGVAHFPKREKLPPPPQKERKNKPAAEGGAGGGFMAPEPGEEPQQPDASGNGGMGGQQGGMDPDAAAAMQQQREQRMRMRQQMPQGERRIVRRRIMRPVMLPPELPPEPAEPAPQIQMPSPFGPKGAPKPDTQATQTPAPAATPDTAAKPQTKPAELPGGRPSPFGPKSDASGGSSAPEEKAATLPGGRPSPFGPRSEAPKTEAPKADAPKAEAPKSEAPKKAEEPKQAPAELPGGRPSPFGPK